MSRLYNSGNIIAYIEKKNTIFTSLKGILLSYKNSDITKKHNSVATLLDEEIVNQIMNNFFEIWEKYKNQSSKHVFKKRIGRSIKKLKNL